MLQVTKTSLDGFFLGEHILLIDFPVAIAPRLLTYIIVGGVVSNPNALLSRRRLTSPIVNCAGCKRIMRIPNDIPLVEDLSAPRCLNGAEVGMVDHVLDYSDGFKVSIATNNFPLDKMKSIVNRFNLFPLLVSNVLDIIFMCKALDSGTKGGKK